MAEGGDGGMNLFALSLDQLNQLKQSIEEVRTAAAARIPTLRASSANCLRPGSSALLRSRRSCVAWPHQELQGLQGAIQQLQTSRNKLNASKNALDRLSKTPEGTPMLVPITSSLYVPGETAPLDSVLVDVGTGYFIEKSLSQSSSFIERKMALIESQAQNVQSAAQYKQRNLSQTIDVMNQKLMAMRGGAGPSAGGGTAV